jgi:hypothetical protein
MDLAVGEGARGIMGDLSDFRIGPVWSVGWVDWLRVVRSGSNQVAQFRSSVANTEATPRCNINNIYIYMNQTRTQPMGPLVI